LLIRVWLVGFKQRKPDASDPAPGPSLGAKRSCLRLPS
jgi:hypothetical protein